MGDTYVIEANSVYYDGKTEKHTGDLGGKTSNSAIVSVDGNTLTAKKAGKATISFSSSLISDKLTVNVVEKAEPTPEPPKEETEGEGEKTDSNSSSEEKTESNK